MRASMVAASQSRASTERIKCSEPLPTIRPICCWVIGARPNSARMPLIATWKSGSVSSMVPSRSMIAARTPASICILVVRLDRRQLGAHGVDDGLVVRLAEDGGTGHEGIGAGRRRGGDVVDL